jgi:cytoskeleton protein RodZ
VLAWFQASPNSESVQETPVASNTINLPNTATTQQAIDTLELRFTANTKVLIRDSSGKELANGEKVAGETLTVTGESPFAIELNPAAAVQFQFNQKPIDLKPYTVNGVVNFRLSR